MAVLLYNAERQVPSPDDQRCPDEVPVDSVASCAASGFNLYDDAQRIVDGIHFVGHPFSSPVTKEHRPPDEFATVLPGFHVVAEGL